MNEPSPMNCVACLEENAVHESLGGKMKYDN